MWWSRIIPAALAVLLLAGCGYQPVYRHNASAAGAEDGVPAEFAAIHVETIRDRVGQEVRNHLLTMLTPRGAQGAPRYRLSVELTESISALAKRTDETSTRAILNLTAVVTLTSTEREPAAGYNASVSTHVGYDLVDSELSSLVAREGARKIAARQVAEGIRVRLAAYFHNPASGGRRP